MKKRLCILLCGIVSVQVHASVQNGMSAQAKTPLIVADAKATAAGLVPMLTQGLGVTEAQATGGMGSILQAAKGLMSGTDFGSLSKAIPNMDSLLAAAPAVTSTKKGSGDLVGGAIDAASKYSANTKVGKQLLSQFKSLGLSPDMISKFSDVAMNYLKKGEMPQTADLLSSALSGVLK